MQTLAGQQIRTAVVPRAASPQPRSGQDGEEVPQYKSREMMHGLVNTAQGKVMTEDEAQEAIRQTIKRFGRFILAAREKPKIGEVQEFAGLPMKVVRFVTHTEAYAERCEDIWGTNWNFVEDFYFEVEVAD